MKHHTEIIKFVKHSCFIYHPCPVTCFWYVSSHLAASMSISHCLSCMSSILLSSSRRGLWCIKPRLLCRISNSSGVTSFSSFALICTNEKNKCSVFASETGQTKRNIAKKTSQHKLSGLYKVVTNISLLQTRNHMYKHERIQEVS